MKLTEVEDDFLKTGFLPEVEADGAIEAYVINNDNKWSAHQVYFHFLFLLLLRLKYADVCGSQIWGFSDIDGIRYHARNLRFIKFNTEQENADKVINRRLVYDYAPPAE